MDRVEAVEVLNFYRNRHYNAPGGTEEYELANAINEILPRLAYYEDMEEQGRLVVLPCKVGDTVYRIFAPDGREPVISAHTLMSVDYIVRWLDKFGKTVFLTREEAENALKGGAN